MHVYVVEFLSDDESHYTLDKVFATREEAVKHVGADER